MDFTWELLREIEAGQLKSSENCRELSEYIVPKRENVGNQQKLLEERTRLEQLVQDLQQMNKENRAQLQTERELRIKYEQEVLELRPRIAVLENEALSKEGLAKQCEAEWQERLAKEQIGLDNLTVDLVKAFLVQYEFLKNKRDFHATHKLPYKSLLRRICATESTMQLYKEHQQWAVDHRSPEYRDTSTQITKKEQRLVRESLVAVVESSTNTDCALDVTAARRRDTREMAVNTTEISTCEIGVNTSKKNRVTRATQATQWKSPVVDKGTDPAPMLEEADEELCVDLNEIFTNAICPLPDVLSEIGDLPMVSTGCQTELIRNTMTRETITDLSDISRALECRTIVRNRQDPFKNELGVDVHMGINPRPLEEFEKHWNLAGRSLINSLFDMRPREIIPKPADPLSPSANSAGFHELLQNEMVAKFLNGSALPVKKAVSIPSVYAESTKSGYERDEVIDEDSRGFKSSNGSDRSSPSIVPQTYARRRISRENSKERLEEEERCKRRRRDSVEGNENVVVDNSEPVINEHKEVNALTRTQVSSVEEINDDVEVNNSDKEMGEVVNSVIEERLIQEVTEGLEKTVDEQVRPFRIVVEPMETPTETEESVTNRTQQKPPRPRKVRVATTNRTVNRILRSRATLYKMRPTVQKRPTVALKKPKEIHIPVVSVAQEEEHQIIQPKCESDSKVHDIFMEPIQDFFAAPPPLDPIPNDDLSDDGGKAEYSLDDRKREELRNDLNISSDNDSDEFPVDDQSMDMELDLECSQVKHKEFMSVSPRINTEILEGPEFEEIGHKSPINTEIPEEPESKENVHNSHFTDYDSPASPPPTDCSNDPMHEPVEILTERRQSKNIGVKKELTGLKITNTTVNQFIQNMSPLPQHRGVSKVFEKAVKDLLDTYMDSDWTSESVRVCFEGMVAIKHADPEIKANAITRIILDTMAKCTDDLIYEPFASLAPHMPISHQMIVQLIHRLGIAQKVILDIERRLFTLKPVDSQTIVNLTYIYLTLQDLEVNQNGGPAKSLRLFVAKALYFMKRSSTIILVMTLKVFPRLLPQLQFMEYYQVGKYSRDPLVDVIVWVAMNPTQKSNTSVSNQDQAILRIYQAEWAKLQKFYRYQPAHPRDHDVYQMLLDRLRRPEMSLNVVHGIVLMAKHKNCEWVSKQLLLKDAMPRLMELLSSEGTLDALREHELCQWLTVIPSVLKAFPKTEDMTPYRHLFRAILVDRERYPQWIQEHAVMSILRLAGFGVNEAFNAIRDWYAPPKTLSPQLRMVLKTFISRKPGSFWVTLSNDT